MTTAGFGAPSALRPFQRLHRDRAVRSSYNDECQFGVEPAQVVGIAGDDAAPGSASADDDVRVGDLAGAAGGEQSSDVGGVHPVEGRDVGAGLPQEPGQPGLPCRVANRLS